VARGCPATSKAWLRRRLHAAIVCDHLDGERWQTESRSSKIFARLRRTLSTKVNFYTFTLLAQLLQLVALLRFYAENAKFLRNLQAMHATKREEYRREYSK
jgi:IS4 transposase